MTGSSNMDFFLGKTYQSSLPLLIKFYWGHKNKVSITKKEDNEEKNFKWGFCPSHHYHVPLHDFGKSNFTELQLFFSLKWS